MLEHIKQFIKDISQSFKSKPLGSYLIDENNKLSIQIVGKNTYLVTDHTNKGISIVQYNEYLKSIKEKFK